MKKLVLVLTTIALVMTMAFGVSAKSKVKSVTVKGAKKNITLTVGDKKTYTVKVKAKKGYKGFKVKSSKKKIVKVKKKSNKITITALKKGKATVTVTSKKNKKKKYKLIINVTNNQKNTSEPQYEDTGYSEQERQEIIRQNQEAVKQKEEFEAQGLKRDEDFFWGTWNGKEICVLKYTNTYIDDEVLQLLENDRKEVAEKSKTDPYYSIDRQPLFKEKVYYGVGDKGETFSILFVGKRYIQYGLYSNTGELPTPEHYSYKKVNGIVVDGEEYEGYDIRKKNYKYETSISYDVDENIVGIGKQPAWNGD